MANFCTNCGRELTPGAVFCENCGVKNEVGAPAPQQTAQVPQKKTNGCAIAGFIMSLLCGCLSPVALILSIIGISKSKTTGTGKGLAIAGTIISALGLILSILSLLFMVPAIIAASESGDDWYDIIEEAFEQAEDYDYDYDYGYNSYGSSSSHSGI